MAWSWTIQKAAVEQEILFPSRKCYEDYIETLRRKEEVFEIVKTMDDGRGAVLAIIRKRYNNNRFLFKKESM